MNLQKKSTFFFTEEENKVLDADIVSSPQLLKETSLHWWYNKINKKEHREDWGYNEVMREIECSPPTNAMKRGGIEYQKGAESFSRLQN